MQVYRQYPDKTLTSYTDHTSYAYHHTLISVCWAFSVLVWEQGQKQGLWKVWLLTQQRNGHLQKDRFIPAEAPR